MTIDCLRSPPKYFMFSENHSRADGCGEGLCLPGAELGMLRALWTGWGWGAEELTRRQGKVGSCSVPILTSLCPSLQWLCTVCFLGGQMGLCFQKDGGRK